MMAGTALTAMGDNDPDRYRVRARAALVSGLVAAGLAVAIHPHFLAGTMITAALVLIGAGFALHRHGRGIARKTAAEIDVIKDFVARDTVPCFITDEMAQLEWSNKAARRRFGDQLPANGASPAIGLSPVLQSTVRDIGAISLRLLSMAEAGEDASEEIVLDAGHARLSVHQAGAHHYFWRFEEFGGRSATDERDEPGLPRITVGRNGTVLHMNEPARKFVGRRVKTLDKLFSVVPPLVDQTNIAATEEGPKPCLVAHVRAAPGRDEYMLLPAPAFAEALSPTGAPDISHLPVPLLTVGSDGRIQSINEKARKLIAVPDAVGELLWDHMEGLGRPIRDWLHEAAEGRDLHRSEFLRLKRVDRETFVQVTLARVETPGQDGAVLYVVLNDATELKTLEAQFVQSQKMQAIGQLAGGVAHDFNNLLTAITGHCDLLLLRHDQGDQDFADLMQINQNANRAAALVGQLLAFSRKQMLKAEPLDLRDTMADLTHLLNRLVGEKVELVLSHDPLLHQIRADKRQLEQVIMNLVVNARDAMTEGGRIEIETANLTVHEAQQRGNARVPPGQYVSVKVRDEGPGIPSDKIDKVFEPFFTTKRMGEGTGLGLSTAYGIVKQTGGYIFVDSTEGEGAEFLMLFPASKETPQKAGAPISPDAQRSRATSDVTRRQDGVVLLVEDEAPVRAFASRALKLRGFTVLEADCAEAALDTLEDADLSVDVFVTDVVMPGLDGPSWVRKALKNRPETRVVFMSGYAEDALDDTENNVPNSVFLPKPFSLAELTDTVARQIS